MAEYNEWMKSLNDVYDRSYNRIAESNKTLLDSRKKDILDLINVSNTARQYKYDDKQEKDLGYVKQFDNLNMRLMGNILDPSQEGQAKAMEYFELGNDMLEAQGQRRRTPYEFNRMKIERQAEIDLAKKKAEIEFGVGDASSTNKTPIAFTSLNNKPVANVTIPNKPVEQTQTKQIVNNTQPSTYDLLNQRLAILSKLKSSFDANPNLSTGKQVEALQNNVYDLMYKLNSERRSLPIAMGDASIDNNTSAGKEVLKYRNDINLLNQKSSTIPISDYNQRIKNLNFLLSRSIDRYSKQQHNKLDQNTIFDRVRMFLRGGFNG